MPATIDELPEEFGRYRIQKTLGKGGMGTVYLARDRQLDRLVAQARSTSSPSFRKAFSMQTLSAIQSLVPSFLRSPRAASIAAVGPDGSLYVTEDVKGKTWRIMYKK